MTHMRNNAPLVVRSATRGYCKQHGRRRAGTTAPRSSSRFPPRSCIPRSGPRLERRHEQDLGPNRGGGGRPVRHAPRSPFEGQALNGDRRHVAVELATKLVRAAARRPVNDSERRAFTERLDQQREPCPDLAAVDRGRGDIGDGVIVAVFDAGLDIVGKPRPQPNEGRLHQGRLRPRSAAASICDNPPSTDPVGRGSMHPRARRCA